MHGGEHRAADCDWAAAASSILARAVCRAASGAGKPDAGRRRLRTPQGKQLYGLRKQTPEPVLGIIKSVMGFRQFLLRGLDCVRGEWSLVTMAWNIKRMHALSLG
jgi:Transposase DDE domain